MAGRLTRRGIERLDRNTGIWRGEGYQTRMLQMQIDAERDAADGIARAKASQAALDARIVHPVLVDPPSRPNFRVIRLFSMQSHLSVEDIGACATEREALAISTREQWRAQVLDRNGTVTSDNWRAIEKR